MRLKILKLNGALTSKRINMDLTVTVYGLKIIT
jgi:hypothetical protein